MDFHSSRPERDAAAAAARRRLHSEIAGKGYVQCACGWWRSVATLAGAAGSAAGRACERAGIDGGCFRQPCSHCGAGIGCDHRLLPS